jgi:hypothetical protein
MSCLTPTLSGTKSRRKRYDVDNQVNAASLVRSDALLVAGDLLADYTGSCPQDVFSWEHPDTCEKHCSADAESGCWVEYAKFIATNASLTLSCDEPSPPTTCSAHWSVSVQSNGEDVLTIEHNHLCGVADIDKHGETIREAARHLLAFIGESPNAGLHLPTEAQRKEVR